MTLKELLKIAGQQGKVVIVGDDGEVKGIFLSNSDYQKLKGQTPVIATGPDPEKVNREILEAQLKDSIDTGNKNLEIITPPVSAPTPIGTVLAKRAQELFATHPYGRQEAPPYDMREEVIDPTFGQPVLETETESIYNSRNDSEEEIKPNFDDI